MKIYKISFAGNQPTSCVELKDAVFEGSHHYVHTNGRLIYAIVAAESEIEVVKKCSKIAEEARRNSLVRA